MLNPMAAAAPALPSDCMVLVLGVAVTRSINFPVWFAEALA
jgi:hypothetical protein